MSIYTHLLSKTCLLPQLNRIKIFGHQRYSALMGNNDFSSNDDLESDELADDGLPPIPKTGVPEFDNLSEVDKKRALKSLEDPTQAGVCRQVMARPNDPLTSNQAYHYQVAGKSALEKCATCPTWIPIGDGYCPTCAIEYCT